MNNKIFNRTWASRDEKVWLFAVLGFQLASLLLRSRLDPNPHHDGIILGSAIGASEGLLPNKDTFAQYGPGAPIVQGIWLQIFGNTLLNLRILNALLLMCTSAILISVLSNKIGMKLALLISSIWIFSYPDILPFIPWPSVLTTLFALLVGALLTSYLGSGPRHKWKLYLSSFFLVFGVTFRIQFVLLFFIVTLVFSLKSHFWSSKKDLRLWLFFSGFNVALALIILWEIGILLPFVDETIVWAFTSYGDKGYTFRQLVDLLYFPIGFLIAYALFKLAIRNSDKGSRSTQGFIFAGVFLTGVCAWILSRNNRNSYLAFKHPRILAANIAEQFSYCLLYGSIIYFLILTLVFIRPGSGVKKRCIALLQTNSWVIFVIALGSLPQMYPAFDPLHLWWLTPLFLAGISAVRPFNLAGQSLRNLTLASTAFLLALLLPLYSLISLPRNAFESKVLRGMIGETWYASQLDQSLKMISDFGNKGRIEFACADGIYAAANGYLADGPRFVNWAPHIGGRTTASEYTFACYLTVAQQNEYLKNGFKELASTDASNMFGLGLTENFRNVIYQNPSN